MKIKRLFSRYGREVCIFDRNGNFINKGKCLIQPLRYKNKMYLEGIPTDIGINEPGCYLFLAPPDFDIEYAAENGYLSDGTYKYHIDRSEKIYIGNEIYFIWAIIRLHFPDSYPNYNHFV